MGRPRIKQGKRKLFYLDEETIDDISRNAGILKMSESSYLDFIIKRDKINRNPVFRIKEIQSKKQELQEKLLELQKEEKMAIEDADKLHNWQELKRMKKPEAIKVLQRKLLEGELDEAEEIAKTWSRMTGVSTIELLMEAKTKIETTGI